MQLLTTFRCSLMLTIATIYIEATAGEAVGFIPTSAGMHIGAVIPTTSGQIGVNPVSILPPASMFRGTVFESDAPTATTITKDHKTQTHEIFFAVTTNAAGDLDISIVDPELRSFLEKAAEEVPACVISKLRRIRDAILRRESCGISRFNENFQTFENAEEAIKDLEDQLVKSSPDHPAVKAYQELNPTEGEGSGDVPDPSDPDAVETVELSLASEEELTLLQAGAGPITGALGYEIRNPNSPATGPQCEDNDWSPLPSNVWNGKKGNVYGVFCKNIKPDKKVKITIDPSGKAKPVGWRFERSSTPDPDLYQGYRIDFTWTPNGASDKPACQLGCEEAMESFGKSTCGQKGSGKGQMATTASYNVYCGMYEYRIRKKKTSWVLGEQKCYKPDEFGKHKDVGPPQVRSFSKKACKNVKGYRIFKGDEDSVLHHEFTNGGVTYHFEARWDDDCELEEKHMTETNAWTPLGPNDIRCPELFENNFKNCNNGGVGGEIMAGCAKYIFKALPEK
ncbi:hypothetical protein G7Z17_g634 [Cylindrodendrum hubeiense]|uniref:Uncharacterized protein n=1 Tax=Cylindrodendrum hubeiense TaxID=595255 RepID=A0A9P5HL39_9HYPO|nr:hypothetical protein G7Z17_g634 [Cylindrodendrum hubeiense]